MSKKVLGKGLGAFFPEYDDGEESVSGKNKGRKKSESPDAVKKANVVLEVPVAHIRANPNQPRKEFNEKRLDELADSIRQHGIIQPVTVRYIGEKRFELVSGERRLKACKIAGMQQIPAYIREVDDDDILTFALIENIQREDLNPIEIAMGYQRLVEEMEYTQAEVAGKVGKNRTTVTNMLRLLHLPDFIQAALRDELISTGHARALINLKDPDEQKKILNSIINADLSVRDIEEYVRNLEKKNKQKKNKKSPVNDENPFLNEISERLRRTLSTRVDIKEKKKGGEIRISYYSSDDLERILHLFEKID